MGLFRRDKNEEVLPDEVRDYYKNEQRSRTGMAWLLAVGGFLLTVAIVFALFFAGRWAYQAIFVDDDDGSAEVVDEQEDIDVENDETPFIERDDNTEDNNTEDEDNVTNGESADDGTTNGDDGSANGIPDTGPGDSEEPLPRTGPSN